jgi:quinol monooxygenase YgiN
VKVFASVCVITGLLAAAAAAQTNNSIQDVYIAKVKPEKRADFDAAARKIADANRKAKGDIFIAYSVEYGDHDTIMFSSVRENFAAIDTGIEKFEAAMKEGFGPTFMKLFQDMSNCVVSSRSEVRRRRMDLSRNIPADDAGIYKLVGSSRWMRQNIVRIRPGHGEDFESLLKEMKAGFEKQADGRMSIVSNVIAGDRSGTYYLTSFGKKLGDFEPPKTPLKEIIGEEAYQHYLKTGADAVLMSETMISRILPELSNPPEGIAAIDPSFWRPARKPAAPAAKPAAAATKSGD